MRASLRSCVILALLSACRIADIHFVGPNGDDDANTGDGNGDGITDGPVVVGTAMKKAYLVDSQAGIYPLAKDPVTGRLTYNNLAPVLQPAISTATDKSGTHLYTMDVGGASQGTVHDFIINSDSTLTPVAGNVKNLQNCTPAYAAINPSGTVLAVGCNTNHVVTIQIGANGTLGTVKISAQIGVAPAHPIFSKSGTCLFVADDGGVGFNANILAYQIDIAGNLSNNPVQVQTPSGPRGLALDPSGMYLYVAGNGALTAYMVDEAQCSLIPMTAGGVQVGPSSQRAVIDPTGTYLFVTGTEIDAFKIGTGGSLGVVPGSPFLMAPAGQPIVGATMDPAVPGILYLTPQSSNGAYLGLINAQGAVTMGSQVSVSTTSSVWLQLAP
jgi:6-phosphogluconolactonase (cycloisomerase 2 family)